MDGCVRLETTCEWWLAGCFCVSECVVRVRAGGGRLDRIARPDACERVCDCEGAGEAGEVEGVEATLIDDS